MRVHTIVVGAGSAGVVIASKLSERSDRDVLLIEAGPDYLPEDLPSTLADGRLNAFTHDWGFWHRAATTAPVRFAMPRGRVVGGSSAVNTCIAIRALPRDIDEWGARGLKDWTWDQCLPAFKAIETDLDFDDPWHGRTGPLPLRRHPPEDLGCWQAAFVDAALEEGFPPCADTNNPSTPEGIGPHAMNKIDQRRISAAEAWLTPKVRQREGFTLMADTRVHQVLFEGDRAVGVEVQQGETVRTIHASRVVLCAGSLLTPRLLLRSGIGPAAELDRLGVPCRVDLPAVGARLLDHPGFAFFLRPRRWSLVDRSCGVIQTALRFSTADGPASDIQMQVGSCMPIGRTVLPLVSLMAMLGKPRGHGTIRWPSLDPGSKPVIQSRFLEDPVDRERACAVLRVGHALACRPAMRELAQPIWPGDRVLRNPEALSKRIRKLSDSGYHPCGTVPMGADDDPESATDGRGRVRDVAGLFVADASLMPTIPTGNIHLSTLMIGERIGTWLRDTP